MPLDGLFFEYCFEGFFILVRGLAWHGGLAQRRATRIVLFRDTFQISARFLADVRALSLDVILVS
jgi:hypothetical protein